MNPSSNNHTIEPRDLGNASANVSRVNSPQRKVLSESKSQRVFHTPVMADPSTTTLISQVGHKIPEMFRLKQGSYADLPSAKISELMKSTSLDNAPTQSLLSVVNGILEESVEKRNGEIPQRVACLLRKVVQEIERRISTQAEHLRTQNNLFKAREEKYHSRIKVLEALASRTRDESENERIKTEEKKAGELKHTEKTKREEEKENDLKQFENIKKEEKKIHDKEVIRYIKELEDKNMENSRLKQELETMRKKYEVQFSQLEAKIDETKRVDEKVLIRYVEEIEFKKIEISTLKQELETMIKTKEIQRSPLEAKGEEEKKIGDKEVIRYIKELEDKKMEISTLKQELEIMKKTKVQCSSLEAKGEEETITSDKEVVRYVKELKDKKMEISTLKEELETMKKAYEVQCLQSKAKAGGETKIDDKEVIKYVKELEDQKREISTLQQELETMKKAYEVQCSKLETKAEEEKKAGDKEVIRYIKELEDKNMEISTLKQELESMRKTYEVQCSQLEAKVEEEKKADKKNVIGYVKELEDKKMEISTVKQDLETMKKTYEVQYSQLKAKAEEEKLAYDKKVIGYVNELDDQKRENSTLKQELETMKKTYEVQYSQLEAKVEEERSANDQKITNYVNELEDKKIEISTLKQELETEKKTYEVQCSQLETKVEDAKGELKQKSQEYEHLLEKLRNKVIENEAIFESKYHKWTMKENQIRKSMNFQFSYLQNLKLSWESIKQDVMKKQNIYSEECNRLGVNLKPLVDAAENYQIVLAENRKLFNEIQELKGNIRVYCRLRPFLPGQKEKQSIVEHIGENDLVVANPAKTGKDALKTFKFNKVFGPTSTQGEVYSDVQAFIRSVLDGFNVCIFAYGQTGSGKTYTMSGPNNATPESVGVNYRALNDLFSISTSRKSSIVYDIGVQIIEIYNEQVRDLLSTDASAKKLGILNHSQPNGLAVPDATMLPVKSTSDVIKLMDIGLKNRAKGSTAMNERSSRSHSVVSIHVRGVDQKSGSSLHGNLHLVDLAGSERVDRSEVTGDRLKEAQHINKSLSALGDVIFALSQKSSHVPYRNSKLTQLLQSSLGGQAKTLMLVQINSDIKSFSESLSTLKFAERVSGVELGAAKSTKEGRDVRELMEQVASLKDTILVKDEEIEKLQLLKDLKNVYPGANSERIEAASE
ncbi:kinesin-like protein KIN-14P isoform X2 [Cajanus cajan]|uniref:kinesin-like protein KIN-14P isoform X2 n=1 Tax=Cajanus cajan TaxID=3821 RepID=UPI00098DB437|nr:kinesin-like protein KIN-14P isoform X2 [Cajanus cajan]